MNPGRILIVEDEIILAKEIGRALESLGHEVVGIATSGSEAVAKASETVPDLVLMDIRLEGEMDGIEAAQAMETLVNPAVVYLTAHAEKELFDRAKATGPYGYLTKPVSIPELHRTVELALSTHQMEKRLKASEKRFRLLYEDAPLGYQSLDENGCLIEVNRVWLEALGYTREEAIGTWVGNFLTPRSKEKLLSAFPQFKATGEIRGVEFEMLRKDGSILLASFDGTVSRDAQGNFKQTHCIFHDITRHKRDQQALQESDQRYRMIFIHAPLGIMHFDENGTIIDLNDRFADIIGAPREKILGFNMLERVRDEKMLQAIRDCLNNGSGYYEGDYLSVSGNKLTPIRGMYNKIMSDSGEFLGAVGLLEDVSERKQFEKEKESLREQLFQAQKMEAIGTLAGGIAHDFNNLLQVVLGYADFLVMEPGISESVGSGLAEIRQAAKNGAELVRGLLTLSRRIEPKLRPLNVNSQVEQVRKILQRTLQRMITIEFVPAQGLPPVNADPVQIEQVLMNLAVNARDAMPEGGRLIFETAKVSLDRHYCETHIEARPGAYVKLTVSDTGRGMDTDTAKRIFEPFFSTKAAGEGTGLGLAIVYGIVKQHEGFIRCYSEPGMGTSFHVFLPAIQTKTLSEEPSLPVNPPGGSETILLVDDELPIRRLAEAMLSKVGYRVITASHGREALEIYRQDFKTIDLVILDLIMPLMGGEQCLVEMLRLNPSARVLIASGFTSDGPTKGAIAAGAKGFVGKPYAIRQFLETVRDVLDHGNG